MRLAGADRSAPLRMDPLPQTLQQAVLDELIGEMLLRREAARVRTRLPSATEIAVEVRRMEEESGGAQKVALLLTRLGIKESELSPIALRRALIGLFLHSNTEGTAQISDAEVARVFAQGNHPFVGRNLDDVREEMRALIARHALERDVARWVLLLRGRTIVRIVHERESAP